MEKSPDRWLDGPRRVLQTGIVRSFSKSIHGKIKRRENSCEARGGAANLSVYMYVCMYVCIHTEYIHTYIRGTMWLVALNVSGVPVPFIGQVIAFHCARTSFRRMHHCVFAMHSFPVFQVPYVAGLNDGRQAP